MKDIAIYGAGGFGREILTLIQDINRVSGSWNIIGFFDDGHKKDELVNGHVVLGNIDDLNSWDKQLAVVVANGDPLIKRKIVGKIDNSKVFFPTLIHPTAIIGDTNYVSFGKGCIICAGNIITTNICFHDFVTLNLACTVGHNAIIGNYTSIMPAVNISGEVTVGDAVYLGTGVKIINRITVGDNVVVGAGAVIAKNLTSDCTAVGVPAKPIKFNK